MVKKTYVAPLVTKYSSLDQLPERLLVEVSDVLSIAKANVICDSDRHYRSVSTIFASLLGYSAEELRGKTIDELTVTDSVNVERTFDQLKKLGEMTGLWLFKDRRGHNKLFRYTASRITDQLILAEFEPLQFTI
jgi:PAS domain S-box-containing protein